MDHPDKPGDDEQGCDSGVRGKKEQTPAKMPVSPGWPAFAGHDSEGWMAPAAPFDSRKGASGSVVATRSATRVRISSGALPLVLDRPRIGLDIIAVDIGWQNNEPQILERGFSASRAGQPPKRYSRHTHSIRRNGG